jgi:hypothetical protein
MYYGVVPTVGRFDLLWKANALHTEEMIGYDDICDGQ